jgi:microcompartment protein CcmL/EutN
MSEEEKEAFRAVVREEAERAAERAIKRVFGGEPKLIPIVVKWDEASMREAVKAGAEEANKPVMEALGALKGASEATTKAWAEVKDALTPKVVARKRDEWNELLRSTFEKRSLSEEQVDALKRVESAMLKAGWIE